jgi:hypothetical protein
VPAVKRGSVETLGAPDFGRPKRGELHFEFTGVKEGRQICPALTGGMPRDHTQTRRLPIRSRNWNRFMRQYAHLEEFRIGRNYAPGIHLLVALFPMIFLPGMLSYPEYSFSQSREDSPCMIRMRVEDARAIP